MTKGCGKRVDDGTNDFTEYICGKTRIVDWTGDEPKAEEIWLCQECAASKGGTK